MLCDKSVDFELYAVNKILMAVFYISFSYNYKNNFLHKCKTLYLTSLLSVPVPLLYNDMKKHQTRKK